MAYTLTSLPQHLHLYQTSSQEKQDSLPLSSPHQALLLVGFPNATKSLFSSLQELQNKFLPLVLYGSSQTLASLVLFGEKSNLILVLNLLQNPSAQDKERKYNEKEAQRNQFSVALKYMTQGSDHIINMNELMKRLYPSFINMKGTQEYNNIKVELVHNKKPSQLSINLGPHVKCFNSN